MTPPRKVRSDDAPTSESTRRSSTRAPAHTAEGVCRTAVRPPAGECTVTHPPSTASRVRSKPSTRTRPDTARTSKFPRSGTASSGCRSTNSESGICDPEAPCYYHTKLQYTDIDIILCVCVLESKEMCKARLACGHPHLHERWSPPRWSRSPLKVSDLVLSYGNLVLLTRTFDHRLENDDHGVAAVGRLVADAIAGDGFTAGRSPRIPCGYTYPRQGSTTRTTRAASLSGLNLKGRNLRIPRSKTWSW